MRAIAGTFGVVCGALLIALVARYGYKSCDDPIDGVITGFLFAVITAGGLGGHMFTPRLWRRNKTMAVVVSAICFAALVVNISNSVGAIAIRGDQRDAERTQKAQSIQDERAQLTRMTRERDAMPVFQPTTVEAVTAASAAVVAAESVQKAECDKRGSKCRDRETETSARRGEHAQVLKDRAATERAAKLDVEIAALQERLATVKPVGSVNPEAKLLTQVLRLFLTLPDGDGDAALYYKQLAIAVVVELLIVAALIAFEMLGEQGSRRPAPQAGQETAPPLNSVTASSVAGDASTVGVAEGAPERFCAEVLRRKRGKRLPGAPVYPAYQQWCAQLGLQAVPDETFVDRFIAACDAAKIRREMRDGVLYLADVELAA